MINLATILNTRVANPNACRDQAGSKQSGEDVEKTEDVFSWYCLLGYCCHLVL